MTVNTPSDEQTVEVNIWLPKYLLKTAKSGMPIFSKRKFLWRLSFLKIVSGNTGQTRSTLEQLKLFAGCCIVVLDHDPQLEYSNHHQQGASSALFSIAITLRIDFQVHINVKVNLSQTSTFTNYKDLLKFFRVIAILIEETHS